MHEPSISALLKDGYTKSEIVHRIGVFKEFLEFAFFKENKEHPDKSLVPHFSEGDVRKQKDTMFLEGLPENFFSFWRKETFYDVLDSFSKKLEELPTLLLIMPVELPREEIVQIGHWAREEIGPTLLLDIELDPFLTVGCQLVWKNQQYDFSLSHYFDQHEEELRNIVSGKK